MAKTLMSITVQGKQKNWSFNFWGNQEFLLGWQNDGLDIVIIENTIPQLVVDLGLTKIWCFFQSLLYR